MYRSKRKVKSNGKTVVGQFSSIKKREVQFESGLEEGFLYILNFDSDVTSFHDQPIQIEYKDKAGSSRVYTPDYLVEYKNRKPALFEVKSKHSFEKNRENLEYVFEEARKFASKKSWDFHVITDSQINTVYCDNARFLSRFQTYNSDLTVVNEVLSAISHIRHSTPNQLLRHLSSDVDRWPVYIPAIWTLVFNKKIGLDFFKIIQMETPIWAEDAKTITELKYPYL